MVKFNDIIKVCINFYDINKAYPKNDFPLPNIDYLVDLIIGQEMLSLMDGFIAIIKSTSVLNTNTNLHSQCLGGLFFINSYHSTLKMLDPFPKEK